MKEEKPLVVCATLLIEKSPQALPLGAACIASAIKHDSRTENRFSVALVAPTKEDADYNKDAPGEFLAKKIMAEKTPGYVCLSVYVWNREELEKTAAVLKKMIPHLVVIAGGPEVTANPASFSNSDWCVAGEGENAIPQLLSLLEQHIPNENISIPGVFHGKKERAGTDRKVRRAETAAGNGASPPPENERFTGRAVPPPLDTLCSPYLDGTLDVSDYEGALFELARGCPFKCAYCYESKGEKAVRYFPLERIEKELELFAEKKIRQVFVLDPTYNIDKKRALTLLRLIAEKAPGIFFYFEARAEFIDRELAAAFTQIPCALQIGLQSADETVLRTVNRPFDRKKFVRNIGCLNEAGAVFGFDLIYGLPKDTLHGFRKSLDFALGLYPNNVETFCLSVLPGTPLAETAESLGVTYSRTPPYHVIHTDCFSESEMQKAGELSEACTIFYNDGRAVPWFNTVCRFFKMRPSQFLEDFFCWYSAQIKSGPCRSHSEIEKVQLAFVREKCNAKRSSPQERRAVESIIQFNGALSRVESDGTEETARLSFRPDDLVSQYATDISFFARTIKSAPCTVRCFRAKSGQIDWRTIK